MEVVLKNLTKEFVDRKGNKTVAVSNFDTVIPSGKLIGLLGPSGCGKSTTLYLIAGLHKASGGQIFFGDTDVTNLAPENRGIGLVFQNYALYPHMTVRQNIMFPLENMKLPRKEILDRTLQMAKLVDIDKYLDRKPKELSGGQQQRVAIARALVKMPKVLLLDEPLSNLDARLRLQTREEIKRIQRETGITTIFVTHDQEEAMSISDEIIVMSAGEMQQKQPPQEVYDDPANLFVAKFLGNPAINIFEGSIRSGVLFLGETKLDNSYEGEDRKVLVGIRPEAFIPDDKGQLEIVISFIEHIGRDISIIGHAKGLESKTRIIIPAEHKHLQEGDTVRFNYRSKYVFEVDGKRIR